MLELNVGELCIIQAALRGKRSELQSRLEASHAEGVRLLLGGDMAGYKAIMDRLDKYVSGFSRHTALIAKITAEMDS